LPFDPIAIPPGIYTYEEIIALGFDPGLTPEETGLPLCEPDP